MFGCGVWEEGGAVFGAPCLIFRSRVFCDVRRRKDVLLICAVFFAGGCGKALANQCLATKLLQANC